MSAEDVWRGDESGMRGRKRGYNIVSYKDEK